MGVALPALELFLRQFLRMFISLRSYRYPRWNVGYGCGV